jgi:hypothetical protein
LEEIKLIFCWEKVAIFWSVCGPWFSAVSANGVYISIWAQ